MRCEKAVSKGAGRYLGLSLLAVLLAIQWPALAAAEEAAKDTAEDVPEKSLPYIPADNVDPKDWGIRHGCIKTYQIRNIDFFDDEAGIVTMRGNKKILLRFRNRCTGIKHSGFVHKTRNNELCAGTDIIRVIDGGWSCVIESFEPVLGLDDSNPEDDDPE